jgi:hypothetical protein
VPTIGHRRGAGRPRSHRQDHEGPNPPLDSIWSPFVSITRPLNDNRALSDTLKRNVTLEAVQSVVSETVFLPVR